MFNIKNKYPLGLDISDLSLKLVQLNKIKDKIKIQGINKVELPIGIIENGEIKDKQEVIKYIGKLLSKPKYGTFTTNDIITCLPETKTFIKLIYIDNSPNNISDIIESEIEKHIPMSIKNIYYDWQIVDRNNDQTKVLIGAAPVNIVNQYIDLLKSAKMNIKALEIECTAICRSLLIEETPKFNKTSNNYAIIDIGAKRSSIIIYANNTVILSISVPISGNEITERISKALEISKEQAEKAKIICGLNKDKAQGIIKDILSDMIINLNSRIKYTIDFYNNNYAQLGPIKNIILCGGGSNINNLSKMLENDLSIKTIIGDPYLNLNEIKDNFSKIFIESHDLDHPVDNNKDAKHTIKQDSSISYSTAIGLALRNIMVKE